MPAPPKKGETQKEFLARCIPFFVDEGKPQDQAVAICYSMWREKDKSDESKIIKKFDKYLDEDVWKDQEGLPTDYKEQHNIKCCFSCRFAKPSHTTNGIICTYYKKDELYEIEPIGICPKFKS